MLLSALLLQTESHSIVTCRSETACHALHHRTGMFTSIVVQLISHSISH